MRKSIFFITCIFLLPTSLLRADTWKTVSSKGSYTLAIQTDGSLWEWGVGPLGISKIPKKIGEDTDWKAVAVGGTRTYSPRTPFGLAIKENGTLWSFGFNNRSQLGLGDGAPDFVELPTKIDDGTDWEVISASNYCSAAIKSDKSLWVWGYSGSFDAALGLGEQDNSEFYQKVPKQLGSDKWQTVSAGARFFIAIKTNNSLYSWGSGKYGELGNGTNDGSYYSDENNYIPTRIGSDNNWSKVSVGRQYVLAIKENGTLWAWGYNDSGQLGNGKRRYSTDAMHVKERAPIKIGSDTDWLSVSAGDSHSVALKTDNTVWVWGRKIGVRFIGNPLDSEFSEYTLTSPTKLEVGNYSKIFTGDANIMGIKSDNSMWGWGSGYTVGRIGMQESIFDKMSQFVQILVIFPLNYTVFSWWNNRIHILSFCFIYNGITIIPSICKKVLGLYSIYQRLSLLIIRFGTFCDNCSDRHTMRIHGQMYLGVEPPFVRLIS